MREVSVAVQYSGLSNCNIVLSKDITASIFRSTKYCTPERTLCCVLKLICAAGRTSFVGWKGDVVSQSRTVVISEAFARSLRIDEHSIVSLSCYDGVNIAKSVSVIPVSENDWDVVEHCSGWLENNLLEQISVLSLNMAFPVWVNSRMPVYMKVCSSDVNNCLCFGLSIETQLVVDSKSRIKSVKYNELSEPLKIISGDENDPEVIYVASKVVNKNFTNRTVPKSEEMFALMQPYPSRTCGYIVRLKQVPTMACQLVQVAASLIAISPVLSHLSYVTITPILVPSMQIPAICLWVKRPEREALSISLNKVEYKFREYVHVQCSQFSRSVCLFDGQELRLDFSTDNASSISSDDYIDLYSNPLQKSVHEGDPKKKMDITSEGEEDALFATKLSNEVDYYDEEYKPILAEEDFVEIQINLLKSQISPKSTILEPPTHFQVDSQNLLFTSINSDDLRTNTSGNRIIIEVRYFSSSSPSLSERISDSPQVSYLPGWLLSFIKNSGEEGLSAYTVSLFNRSVTFGWNYATKITTPSHMNHLNEITMTAVRDQLVNNLKPTTTGDSYGARMALVYGPSGSGKSSFVQSVCQKLAENDFILPVTINCAELIGEFLPIRALKNSLAIACQLAMYHSPSVLILDDLDILLPCITSQAHTQEESRNVHISVYLKDLLFVVQRTRRIGIIGISKSVESLSPNLIGNDIFDKFIQIHNPKTADRAAFFSTVLENLLSKTAFGAGIAHEIAGDDNFHSQLASATEGFTVDDIGGAVREAISLCRTRSGNCNVTTSEMLKAVKSYHPRSTDGKELFVSNTEWSDVGGLEDVKLVIWDSLARPWKYKPIFDRLPINMPKGVFLFGPPGCGKTFVAHAAAKECQLRCIAIKVR
eukprot:GHVL01034500.1.p1 GENE.GHVL01034500.1~~GHVL01034500.1.p1  ORF type:complete len:877 (+),score=116.33 GHVL01034500.1:501-3131(+)